MNKKIKTEVFEWLKTICISFVLAFVILSIVQPTIVNGDSMYPTLENKDYLFINKLAYKSKIPERGDIIVFKTNMLDSETRKKKNLVKRIIALPGEHIKIENSKVYINDKQLDESYIKDVYTEGNVDLIVPENSVFTMGDNRPNSLDSRYPVVGTILLDDIVGKVGVRLYPFYKFGVIN